MHVPSKFHIRESGSNMDGVTLSNGTITANGTNSLTTHAVEQFEPYCSGRP